MSFLIIFSDISSQADTSTRGVSSENDYYTDYSGLLTLKPYLLFKLNNLNIYNGEDKLLLSPNNPTSIGVGLNYKFAGIALGFGLPNTAKSIERRGKTNRLDLQISLFMKNLGFDGHFQLYKGYYNRNPGDFMEWDETNFPKLPNMRTISLGASGYYVFNNKRYSNKAAVLRTQKQNKSAGSFLTGLFFSYDEANSPDGFFPKELPDTVASDFDLKGFRYFATGISLGYAYTWVISKSFFLNISAIPGGGYKDMRVVNNSGVSDVERKVHGQVQLRGVFGYESKFFFAGLTALTIIRNMKYKDYELDLATEQIRFFVGWRIDVSKKR
jgi:hypothetical protein